MDVQVTTKGINKVLHGFPVDRKAQNKFLEPLPEKNKNEMDNALHQLQNEVKKIKDEVLEKLNSGSEVDFGGIKNLFEKAESQIRNKQGNIFKHYAEKLTYLPTDSVIDKITDHDKPKSQVSDTKSTDLDKRRGVQKHVPMYDIDNIYNIETLRNIINPKKNHDMTTKVKDESPKIKSKRIRKRPTAGFTSSNFNIENLSNQQFSSPKLVNEERKGILLMIQRKMIPASSSLTIMQSPLTHQKAVLHEHTHKNLSKSEIQHQCNSTLVKFDHSRFEGPINIRPPKIPPILSGSSPSPMSSFQMSAPRLLSNRHEPSREELLKWDSIGYNMDYGKLDTVRALVPCSSMNFHDSPHKLVIQDGKLATGTQEFNRFQNSHSFHWKSVEKLLHKIKHLLTDFSVPVAFIDGDRLADMAEYFEIGPKPTLKDLLMCIINSDDVEKIILIPGRRYLAVDGKDIAAIKIQAIWRCYHRKSIFLEGQRIKGVALKLAHKWVEKRKFTYITMHQKQKHVEHIKEYRARQEEFKQRWPKLKNSKRVIIHLPSLGYSEKTRKTLHNISTRQNCQMGRICDVKDPNVEVIYISSLDIDDVLNDYYIQQIECMCAVTGQDFDRVFVRLNMMVPEFKDSFFPHNLSLSTLVKYSDNLLHNIANLIKGKDAYIVPGYVSDDDVYISNFLKVPVLGPEPNISRIYALKSGLHQIFESAGVIRAPGMYDIYGMDNFYKSLAKLIILNLHITRWIFKIDDAFDGKGTAFCDVTLHLSCYKQAVKENIRYGDEMWKQIWAHERIYNQICEQIPDILHSHAVLVKKSLFNTWEEFLHHFVDEGGIIEACPPTKGVTGITGNVLIEPDGKIEILCAADQVHSLSPYVCWGHTLPQYSITPSFLNEQIISISEECFERRIIGHISIDFVTFYDIRSKSQVLWAVGLKLGYTDAQAMIDLLTFITDATLNTAKNRFEATVIRKPKTKEPYVSKAKRASAKPREKLIERRLRVAVISPNVFHTNMRFIEYHVFFSICKALTISFDEKLKLGTSFSLVSGARREQMGMMTMADNLEHAVSLFVSNLKDVHHEISSPNMSGTNNFEEAMGVLNGILENLKVSSAKRQAEFPTKDESSNRRVSSATRCRTPIDFSEERPRSALRDDTVYECDVVVEDLPMEFLVTVEKGRARRFSRI